MLLTEEIYQSLYICSNEIRKLYAAAAAAAAAAAKSLQSCPTLRYPIHGSPPGSVSNVSATSFQTTRGHFEICVLYRELFMSVGIFIKEISLKKEI